MRFLERPDSKHKGTGYGFRHDIVILRTIEAKNKLVRGARVSIEICLDENLKLELKHTVDWEIVK